jgi:hypothetical protein
LRAVTAATAATTLKVDRKALDNLLARIGSDLIPRGRQGVERRLSVRTLEELGLSLEIMRSLSVPARESFLLSRQLLRRDDLAQEFLGTVELGAHLQLGLDHQAFLTDLNARLASAIESQVRPRRGRPRQRPVATSDLGDA